MFLTESKATSKFVTVVNQRTIQIIILCLISMVLCQAMKVVFFSIKNKKFEWRPFFSTGGFPSSHTSTCVTLTVSLFLFQMHDLNGMVDWSFAVALIASMIIIHDAMGVRYEASKHAKILNHITSDIPDDQKKLIGFGKKLQLKEMLGHKGVEVFGGFIVGVIVAVMGFLLLVNII